MTIIIIVIAAVAWLAVLIAHLNSNDLDPTDKICWTVVLCTLNILGLILYFICAIKSREKISLRSEDNIKKAANDGTLR